MRTLVLLAFVAGLTPTPTQAQDRTFGGYECTDDCSGHKAGYEWAENNQIKDERLCTGSSMSFIEGCRVYVEDPYRGADTDDDGNDID
jgi:hypothetical protein